MSCIITYNNKKYTQTEFNKYFKSHFFEFAGDFISQDIEGFKEFVQGKQTFDKELAQKIQDKLQKLYPEIKLNITNNPVWKQGDNVLNQLIQDDYFEGNPKYFTEVERISNLILNKLKFKTKEFNGKYDESITDLQTYKTKVLNDLLKNIGITGNVTNLNELKERLSSKELETSLKENLEQAKESKENFKNQLDDFYSTKRLLNNYLKHFDLSKYDSSQQARIKQYLPSLFKDNKYKSDKQAIAFNKRRINSEEWANKVFNLDKITLGFLSNNAREKKIETLLNYFKIEPKDATERIYVTIENELNRRERFFTSEKTQAKINAKIAEEKIKADNEKAERERIRTKELNKFKESTVVSEVEGIIGERNIHSLEKVLESESINEELAIIKNNGYSLDKTPNGKKSNLYQTILALPEVNGNTEIANKLKSLVYSNNFTNWFGDWINSPEESSKIVDENGEPKLVYHGSGREYNKFSEEKRGSATGKWKERLSDSEMSFMFTDNPSVAFYYAIIERQQILGEILYYVRKAGQEPTQQLITEMYEKYPSIKHWVNSLKEKGLEKTEILEEFKRIYREYSEIRELSEGGAIGNSNSYLNNMRTAISYLQENKSKILKNGFSKDIGKSTTAKVPNLGKHHTVFFHSSKEYRTSHILADGRLTGFEDKSLNGKDIKDLTSEEYDKVVSQFQEDYVYLYNKIEDELKAGGFQPKIYPVFLNAKSVNSKDFKGRPFMFQQGDTEELVKRRESKGAAFEVADLVEESLNSGLDGSIIENIADPNVGTNYSVFKANQIKSIFNEGEYSSKNDSFYNQLVNGRIVGQANIKAMTVLVDAINQKQDTLPHEYAHHYIAWFRNTPIVQEAIKKWGSEEALVQSIGEQVVKQKGEAYNWWNKFVKWIMNQFNSLSKLQKEELTQILTDAFLTRQDLGSKADIQGFKDFVNKGSNVQTLKGKLDGSKLSEIEGKLEANKDRLIELLGSSMYSEKLKDVVYKELLQNAFDATKIAESKGLISKGKIDIEINEKERIISFTDNGIGMTPEIVQKAFFTIGGTYKGEDVDNKLKSGGLGLAKMAFIFGSEKLSLETIHNGIKTTVDATSEEIRKDNFKIKTEPTNQKNGTKVSIKIPKTYVDSKGENKEIDFPAYSDSEFKYSFLANPLIGNVDINYSIINREVSYRKEEKLKTNLGDIPEGYVLFSPAKTSFADMNIYIDTKNITKHSFYTKHKILSSGLYQFDVNFKKDDGEKIPLNIIIDIKPKVDATNAQYPFNNQRENFKPTVNNDISALNKYLGLLWKSIEIELLKSSFNKIKNIDAVDVENIDNSVITKNKEITKSFTTVSNSDIIKTAVEDFNKKNKEAVISDGGLKTEQLSLTKEDIAKEAEKEYSRTFKADKEISINKETGLNLDSNKPIIHNNTDMTLDEKSTKFLSEISSIMIEYKKSIIDFYGEDYSSNIKNQLWGVSIDKNYGGVNVNPSFLNMLAINPFYNFPTNPKVDAVNYIAVALDHLIIHELNHNFERNEGAGFTGRFLTTYSEIHSLPNHFELMSKLKLTIKNNLEIIKKLNYEYKQSENVESGFEGNKIEDNNQRRADIGIKSISKNDSNNNVGTTINDRGSSEKFGEIINSNLVDNSEIQYSKRESNSNTIDRLATSYSQMLEDENTDLDNGLKEKKLLEYLNKQIKYIDEEGNECAEFGLKTGVSGTNWRIEENLNWGKKHSEGGIDLTMTDDGIVFRRNNSDIKASHGLVIKAEDGLVMPDGSNIDGEDPKNPPKYPKSIKIKDGRVKNPITGKPFNGNKSGDYDYLLMHEVVHNAKKYGIDPYNFLAMAMQETTLGKAGGGMSNPFHILNSSTIESKMDKKRYSEYFKNKTDRMRPVEMAANFYKNVKLLDMPKKKNPNIQDDVWDLQSWNGYGSIYPTTEQHIDGGGDRYGVSIPKEGINMSKNPMYGIWVKDLSNIFRDSKEVNDLVTRIYGPNAPAPYPDRIINDDVSE